MPAEVVSTETRICRGVSPKFANIILIPRIPSLMWSPLQRPVFDMTILLPAVPVPEDVSAS
jgi:hypothetical protein